MTGFRMADYSCGTGELLAAAYGRVRELHESAGGDSAAIHHLMMSEALTAVDILPGSVATAAARLDALEERPADPGGTTKAVTLQSGPICEPRQRGSNRSPRRKPRRRVGLGSLDLLEKGQSGTRT